MGDNSATLDLISVIEKELRCKQDKLLEQYALRDGFKPTNTKKPEIVEPPTTYDILCDKYLKKKTTSKKNTSSSGPKSKKKVK